MMKKKNSGELKETPLMAEKNEQGKHPNSLANLRPFKKGVSGNPGGRSTKFMKLKKALDRWGNDEIPYDFWDMPPDNASTMKEQVLYKIWDKARHGNLRCMEILAQLGCLDDK